MSKSIRPDGHAQPRRSAFKFSQMHAETGVLWAINRVLFHPRGYALAFEYAEGETEPRGWNIEGDGTEVWSFGEGVDEDLFAAFQNILRQAPTVTYATREATHD